MLRYNFECSSKSGFTSCVRLFEEAKTQKKDFLTPDFNVYEISDLAEKMPEIQQTLPAYYNVQISNSYNTKSLYCPYEKLFSGKKMPGRAESVRYCRRADCNGSGVVQAVS